MIRCRQLVAMPQPEPSARKTATLADTRLPLRVAALADGDGLGIRPARKHDATPNFGFRPHATRD